jgi:hypothetical protein
MIIKILHRDVSTTEIIAFNECLNHENHSFFLPLYTRFGHFYYTSQARYCQEIRGWILLWGAWIAAKAKSESFIAMARMMTAKK